MRMHTRKRGFSLVEIMVALTILMIIILGLANTTISFLHETTIDTVRVRAQSFADMRIAEVRGYPTYDNLTATFNNTDMPEAGFTTGRRRSCATSRRRRRATTPAGLPEERHHSCDSDRDQRRTRGARRTDSRHLVVLGAMMTIRQRKGFSLIELMIAIVVMAVVLAGTMNFFMGQSRTFRKATTDMVLLQNARFATDLLNEHFRSVGANLTVGQPAVIYADQNTFAFNADYATNVAGDIDAIYYEPKAPTNEVQSLLKAQAFTIPQSAPAMSYPGADYIDGRGVPSPAEAITFWFAPDTETTRSDDYVLLRQVNASAPEVVVRNVLPDSVYPFFRYMYLKTDPAGVQSIDTIAGADLPKTLRHGYVVSEGSHARGHHLVHGDQWSRGYSTSARAPYR